MRMMMVLILSIFIGGISMATDMIRVYDAATQFIYRNTQG